MTRDQAIARPPDAGATPGPDPTYDAGRPARDAAKTEESTRRALLSRLLPAFLTDGVGALVGSEWVTLHDLCLGGDGPLRGLEGPAPVVMVTADTILSAGTRLRLVREEHETWGAGYLASHSVVLAVEDGPLARSEVSIDRDCRLASGAIARNTAAAVFIVPSDEAPSDPAPEVAARRAAMRDIVLAGQRQERARQGVTEP